MSPSGSYDHADRVGVRTRCSICGALGVNRTTCPKTTPEDHLAHRKEMKSYRKKYDLGARDSIARTGVSEPRYEREWQSINNGEDLTLKIDADEIVGFGRRYDPDLQAFKPTTIDPPSQNGQNRGFLEIPLKIRLKIEVVFE